MKSESYDVVVVGSGIGGLSAGALLAHNGHRTGGNSGAGSQQGADKAHGNQEPTPYWPEEPVNTEEKYFGDTTPTKYCTHQYKHGHSDKAG